MQVFSVTKEVKGKLCCGTESIMGIKAGRTDPTINFSIPLLMGSAAPYILLSCSILSSSCVCSQFFSLASSGWLLFSWEAVAERPERRVSWTPGAEGAPAEKEVCDGVALVGTMRSDCHVC